ncbi:MAG TPA: hypothetical protein VMS98_09705, partial [Thermoanaerobaculia bacterium]|nr:hypothetical protein [Thermoanaerobaculia bacterium]
SPRRVDLRWVPAELLFERGIESFTDVPLWVWRKEREGGFFRARTTRAEAAGLRPRTIQQSFRPMIDAYLLHHADHDLMAGPAIARREAELLGEWDRRL